MKKYIILAFCIFFTYTVFAQLEAEEISIPGQFNPDESDYLARTLITMGNLTAVKADATHSYTFKVPHASFKTYTHNEVEINPEERSTGILTEIANEDYHVGQLPLNFNISQTGAATFSVPIDIPKGINNLHPNVAIGYNSSASDGICGYGGYLNGISVINRTQKTMYYDNVDSEITFDDTDVFSLDGERLLLNSEGEFITYIEKGYEIKPYDTDGDGDPDYFKVKKQDERTYYYGNYDDGEAYQKLKGTDVIYGYYLTRVEDLYGNYINYSYDRYMGEIWLTDIEYTGNDNAGISPTQKVKFNYIKNDYYPPSYYVAGIEVKIPMLLNSIEVEVHGTLHRRYEIEYAQVGVKNVLKKVQPFNGSNNALSPVYFTCNDYERSSKTTGIEYNQGYKYLGGDFNGDGYDDLLEHYFNAGLYLYTNSGESSGGPGFNNGNSKEMLRFRNLSEKPHGVGDINNDGYDDIIYSIYTGNMTYSLVAFLGTDEGPDMTNHLEITSESHESPEFLACNDFNNDGYDDLLFSASESIDEHGVIIEIKDILNSGSTSDDKIEAITTSLGNCTDELPALQIIQDILDNNQTNTSKIYNISNRLNEHYNNFINYYFLSGNEITNNADELTKHSILGTEDNLKLHIADFNNDSRPDILKVSSPDYTTANFSLLLNISSNNEFTFEPTITTQTIRSSSVNPNMIKGIGDFNSDGSPDVFLSSQRGSTFRKLLYFKDGDLFAEELDIYPKDYSFASARITDDNTVRSILNNKSCRYSNAGEPSSQIYDRGPILGHNRSMADYLVDLNNDGIDEFYVHYAYQGVGYDHQVGICEYSVVYEHLVGPNREVDFFWREEPMPSRQNSCNNNKNEDFYRVKSCTPLYGGHIKYNTPPLTEKLTKFQANAIPGSYSEEESDQLSQLKSRLAITTVLSADFDGDGKSDQLRASNNVLTLSLSNQTSLNNRIAGISDSYGNRIDITYTSLQGQHTVDEDIALTDGFMDVLEPMPVVASVSKSRGEGVSVVNTYSFQGAIIHNQLGLLGFKRVIKSNEAFNTVNIQQYTLEKQGQDFYYYLSDNINTPFNQERSKVAYDDLFGFQRYESYKDHVNHTNFIYNWSNSENIIPLLSDVKTYDFLNYSYKHTHFVKYKNTVPEQIETKVRQFESTDVGDEIETSELIFSTYENRYFINHEELHYPLVNRTWLRTYKHYGPISNSAKTVRYEFNNKATVEKVYFNENSDFETVKVYEIDDNLGIALSERIENSEEEVLSELTYSYTDDWRYIDSETDLAGFSISKDIDLATGLVKSETNAQGLTSMYTYDNWGRMHTVTNDFGTATSNYGFASQADKEKIPNAFTYSKVTDAFDVEAFTFYDRFNREIGTKQSNVNGGGYFYSKNTYNNKGQLATTTEPFTEGETENVITYTYDDYGRVLTENDTKGLLSNTTNYGANVITSTNNLTGLATTQNFNALGLLTSLTDEGGTITFEHDVYGNVVTTTYDDQSIVAGYDLLGRKTWLTDPSAGTTSYTYDLLGNMLTQTDANGNSMVLTYDNAGRVETKTINNEEVITYTYVPSGNGIGQVQSITSNTNTISHAYTYNSLHQLESYTEHIENTPYTYGYQYYNNGLLQLTTYPNSEFVTENHYTDFGVLKSMSSPTLSNITIWEAAEYTSLGQLKKLEYNNNSFATTYTYDAAQLLNGISTVKTSNNSSLQNLTYNWNHNEVNLDYREHTTGNGNLKESFDYDDLNRLTSAYGDSYNESVVYENNGNIDTRQTIGDYQYNYASNNMLSHVISHDGEHIQPEHNLMYSAFNKVTEVKAEGYTYTIAYGIDEFRKISELVDKDNKRIKKKIYAGSLYEEEIDTENKVRKLFYVPGPQAEAAVYEIKPDGEGQLVYLLKDHLNSYQTLCKASGEIIETRNYDAWGRLRNPGNLSYDNVPETYLDRGFTGHEHIAELGLTNMNGRFYDPYFGQMISPDNYITYPFATQGYNRYAYAMNNPLIYVDLNGHNVFKRFGKWVKSTSDQFAGWVRNEIFCETCEFEAGYKTNGDGNSGWYFRFKKDGVGGGIGKDQNGWSIVSEGSDGFANYHNQDVNKSYQNVNNSINAARNSYYTVDATHVSMTDPFEIVGYSDNGSIVIGVADVKKDFIVTEQNFAHLLLGLNDSPSGNSYEGAKEYGKSYNMIDFVLWGNSPLEFFLRGMLNQKSYIETWKYLTNVAIDNASPGDIIVNGYCYGGYYAVYEVVMKYNYDRTDSVKTIEHAYWTPRTKPFKENPLRPRGKVAY